MAHLWCMTIVPDERDTSLARLIRVRSDLVEIHYKPGCVMAPKPLADVQDARRELMGNRPYGSLTIIPEDMDFQLDAMRTDHAAADRSQGLLIATAVVCRANMIEMMVKLYFSYFPQLHRIRVTDDEDDARAWLLAQMEEHAQTGS